MSLVAYSSDDDEESQEIKQSIPSNLSGKRKKVQIYLDLPKESHDETDVREELPSKKPKGGLFSMLPPPKSTSSNTSKKESSSVAAAKSSLMIPPRVSKKAQSTKSISSQPPIEKSDAKESILTISESNDEQAEELDSFFTIDTSSNVPEETDAKFKEPLVGPVAPSASAAYSFSSSSAYMYDPNVYAALDQGHTDHSQNTAFTSESLNDARLEIREKGQRKNVEIRDINQQEILGDESEREALRANAAMAPAPMTFSRAFTAKNNIMVLAHQARARAVELEQASARRIELQRQTRAKYGF